jgi:hypothetical protein
MIGKSLNERWAHRKYAAINVQRRVEQVLGNTPVPDELRREVTKVIEAGPAEVPTIIFGFPTIFGNYRG